MITARYYEDMMKDLIKNYDNNPNEIKKQMDRLNIETLSSLGYSAGAKLYSEKIGVKLKDEHNG